MKILLLTEYYPPQVFGGGEHSAKSLADSLAAAGDDVTVLTSGGMDDAEEKGAHVLRRLTSADEVGSLAAQWTRSVILARSVRRVLPRILKERGPFDIAHCPNPTNGVVVRAAGPVLRRARVPFLCTVNGYGLFCPKGNLFYKERAPCTGHGPLKCAGCIAASAYIGKARNPWWLRYNPAWWMLLYAFSAWRRKGIRHVTQWIPYTHALDQVFARNKVPPSIIHPTVNIVRPFARTATKEIRAKMDALRRVINGRLCIAAVGALERVKGFDLLVQALARSGKRDILILLIGDGPMKASLLAQARKAGVECQLHIERVPYALMPAVYRVADAVALPSRYPEPFARVCAEAAFFGKPLLTTDAGGNYFGLIDGKSGHLLPADDLAWASCLRGLTGKGCRRMGKRAKALYKERFDPDKTVQRIRKIYKKAMA